MMEKNNFLSVSYYTYIDDEFVKVTKLFNDYNSFLSYLDKNKLHKSFSLCFLDEK